MSTQIRRDARLTTSSTSVAVEIPTLDISGAPPTPTRGLIAYDTQTDSIWYADGSQWLPIGSGGSSFDPADPVFHGTGTTNGVLGTVTVGPRLNTDPLPTPLPGQITIGGYSTDLGLTGFNVSPSSLAPGTLLIGCGVTAGAPATAVIGIGGAMDLTCPGGICIGRYINNSGTLSVNIGSFITCEDAFMVMVGNGLTGSNGNDGSVLIGGDSEIRECVDSTAICTNTFISASDRSTILGSVIGMTGAVDSIAIGGNIQMTGVTGGRIRSIGYEMVMAESYFCSAIGDSIGINNSIGGVVVGAVNSLDGVTGGVAIGNNVGLTNQRGGVAIGHLISLVSFTEVQDSIAIGTSLDLSTAGNRCRVIGNTVKVEAEDVIFIGSGIDNTLINGNGSINIGSNPTTNGSSNAIAIGTRSGVTGGSGIAIGLEAAVTNDAQNQIAIGTSATSNVANGIAIGEGAVADTYAGGDAGLSITVPADTISPGGGANGVLRIMINGFRYTIPVTADP